MNCPKCNDRVYGFDQEKAKEEIKCSKCGYELANAVDEYMHCPYCESRVTVYYEEYGEWVNGYCGNCNRGFRSKIVECFDARGHIRIVPAPDNGPKTVAFELDGAKIEYKCLARHWYEDGSYFKNAMSIWRSTSPNSYGDYGYLFIDEWGGEALERSIREAYESALDLVLEIKFCKESDPEFFHREFELLQDVARVDWRVEVALKHIGKVKSGEATDSPS